MSGPSWTLSVPYGADQTVYLVADRGCRCCRIRPQQVTTTTLVLTHNLFGRTYLTVIMPFHRLVVRAMLRKLAA